MLKKLLLLFILCISFYSNAQYFPISEEAEISILTIGPGDQLYDKFGHSAFRVNDSKNEYDIIYNYGTYDFNTPNFYTKFARGKLLYKLSGEYYKSFLERYKRQNRFVKEQVLNLQYSDKVALFNYLQNNAKPENCEYKYDFFFDNCATRIRDVLVDVLGDKLTYRYDFIDKKYTFRELIQKNVPSNSWGSLGMDVAIGAVVDREATPWEYQFLPDYVYKASAKAVLKTNTAQIPLVKETNSLFEDSVSTSITNFIISPFFVFSVLGALILVITFLDFRRKKRTRVLDTLLFFFTGIVGIILLLLWAGTDHSTTVNNYNLLWAFPINLLLCFSIYKRTPKKWMQRYVFFLILMLFLLTIHWITGVQVFAKGFIPLFVGLAIRYIYLFNYLKRVAS